MKKKSFVIVRIFGGLGNQLWQYAFARNLSIQLNKPLILDISFYKHPLIDLPEGFKAKFELNKFNLPSDIYIEDNIYNHSYRFYKYFLRFLNNYFKKFFFNNQNFLINNFIFENYLYKNKKINIQNLKKGSSYFIGYWQSKEYFSKNVKKIQNDLKLKKISTSVKNYCNRIKNNYVAIHLRGGDISIEKNYKNTDEIFYHKIFKILANKKINFKFHIFTDDVNFAKKFIKKLKIKKYKIISDPKKFTNLEEFYLMQHYKYLIISRSTFSWWTSFLLNNKKKIIFAPKIWYRDNLMPKGLKLENMILI